MFDSLFSGVRIRAFFPVAGAATLAMLLLACALTYGLFSAYNEWVRAAREKAEIQTLTDELRQSSDDLTRFARLYAVTGEQIYVDNYREVLAIHSGEAPRPHLYEHIYWDLSPEMREARHPKGPPESLSMRFGRLPLLPSERVLMQTSRDFSNALAQTELNFFKFSDESDLQRARELLFSPEYQKRKSEVMLPLDDLLHSLEVRYAETTDGVLRRIDVFFAAFAVLLAVFLALAALMQVYARKKVLAPMHHLLANIRDIRRGVPPKRRIFYSDEFGELMRQFYSMKEQMDRSYHDLEMVSFTDELTGLYNRHYFFQVAKQQAQVAVRSGHPVCVIICDVDHFKSINDTHGHLTGDEALKHVAGLVRGSVRESDLCARFGGEEFVVLLNNSNIDNSAEIGEKIRAALEGTPCHSGDITLNMTISIGVSIVEGSGEGNINDAIDQADKALYEAKNAGRNRVHRA